MYTSNTELYKQMLMPCVIKYLPKVKIYLFGSRARKTEREGSDIDIVLDAGAPISESIMGSIKEELEESQLPVSVDVVDWHNISDSFKKNIEKDMVLWLHI